MKPFHVNSNGTAHRLTLPIQFMKFGVEDQEIVVPIRCREKSAPLNGASNLKSAGAPPSPPTDLTVPGRGVSRNTASS